jgi:hypothetical protein
MVVYMLRAEAVIPLALGAVAELKLWMLRVRFAADGAFPVVESISLLLLLLGLFRGFLKVDNLLRVPVFKCLEGGQQ